MREERQQTFAWLPAQMPRVAALVATRRLRDGDAHVNECWRRGVLLGEPGWFFAREGAVAVGTPDPKWSWPELEALPDVVKPALLLMKDREVAHGTN